MPALARRLTALEQTRPSLSPRALAWLGQGPAVPDDGKPVHVDTRNFSPELKRWLGLD